MNFIFYSASLSNEIFPKWSKYGPVNILTPLFEPQSKWGRGGLVAFIVLITYSKKQTFWLCLEFSISYLFYFTQKVPLLLFHQKSLSGSKIKIFWCPNFALYVKLLICTLQSACTHHDSIFRRIINKILLYFPFRFFGICSSSYVLYL